jgi:hypothetical protein
VQLIGSLLMLQRQKYVLKVLAAYDDDQQPEPTHLICQQCLQDDLAIRVGEHCLHKELNVGIRQGRGHTCAGEVNPTCNHAALG